MLLLRMPNWFMNPLTVCCLCKGLIFKAEGKVAVISINIYFSCNSKLLYAHKEVFVVNIAMFFCVLRWNFRIFIQKYDNDILYVERYLSVYFVMKVPNHDVYREINDSQIFCQFVKVTDMETMYLRSLNASGVFILFS